MAQGFKVADAYVDVVAKVRDRDLAVSAREAGDAAGGIIGDQVVKTTGTKLRDSRGRFRTEGRPLGESLGDGLGDGVDRKRGMFGRVGGGLMGSMGSSMMKGLGTVGSNLGDGVGKLATNPYVLAGIGVFATGVAPLIIGALGGAVTLAAGAGVIGLGAMLLKEEPALVKAATKLKDRSLKVFKDAAKPMLAPLVSSLNEVTKRVTGEWKPLFDGIFGGAAKGIKPLTDGLLSLLDGMLPGFESLMESFGPFMKELEPAFKDMGKSLGEFFALVAQAGPDSAVALGDLLRFLGWVVKKVGENIVMWSKFYVWIRKVWTSIPGWTSSAASAVGGFFGRIGDWFGSLPGKAGAALSAVGQWFSDKWGQAKSATTGFFSDLGAWFGSLPGKFGGWLSAAWAVIWGKLTELGGWFSALPGRIGGLLAALPGAILTWVKSAMDQALFAVGFGIGSVIKFFRDLPGNAAAAASRLWGAISSAFTTARDRAVSTATALVTNVVTWVKGLPGKARSAVASLWSNMTGAFSSAKSGATNSATGMVNSVVTWFRGLPGKARSAVASLWSSMSGAFSSAKSAAVAAATSLVNGAVNYLKTLPGKARSAVAGVKSSITGVFSGAGSWLHSAGANIMKGLASGIKSAVGAAVSAAKSAVGSVVSGAKSALGIKSPSAVMGREVGRWMLPGVTDWMWKTLPKARRQVADVMKRLVPGMGTVRPGGRDWTGVDGLRRPYAGGAGTSSHVVNIGTVTLDASGVKSIQDVVDLITGLTTTARSTRARVATVPGR